MPTAEERSRFQISNRLFWWVVAALLAYLGTVQVFAALRESAIGDEPTELTAGYAYLTTGTFGLDPEHPPFDTILAALPLLAFHLDFPELGARNSFNSTDFGRSFFAANASKEDGFLFAARLTTIFLTLCLGLSIVLWTRSTFSSAAALIALTLFAFDPTIAAMGHYAKNDVPVTLFMFLTCIAWSAFLNRPSPKRLGLAGLALGVALATKFSALLLIPMLLILYGIRYWQSPKTLPIGWGILSFVAVAYISLMVVFLSYAIPAGVHGKKTEGVDAQVFRDLVDRDGNRAGRRESTGVVRGHPYLAGLRVLLDHNTVGHKAYLLGRFRDEGWWYYFPVAFAVKMPVATLGLLGLAGWALVRRVKGIRPRLVPLAWFALGVPVFLIGLSGITSHINIGIRHILPMWPFLFALAGALVAGVKFRYAGAMLAVLGIGLAIESIAIFPHYLAFFNVLAGGPDQGPKILLDSNIDWGQDAKGLSRWLRENPSPRVCLDYFGNANMQRLGLTAPLIPSQASETELPDCVAAISVNVLYGMTPFLGDFSWLQQKTPIARIGHSIYIYDLTKRGG